MPYLIIYADIKEKSEVKTLKELKKVCLDMAQENDFEIVKGEFFEKWFEKGKKSADGFIFAGWKENLTDDEIFIACEEVLGCFNAKLVDKNILSEDHAYYWTDPDGGFSSDLCKIISYPFDGTENKEQLLMELEINGYELVNASDFYKDGNSGFEYGVHVGTYRFNGESIDIEDVEWFSTEEERAKFIAQHLQDRVNIDAATRNNPFIYPDDGIFLIETASGSEAEVTNNELTKVVSQKEVRIGNTLSIISFTATKDADGAAYLVLSEATENGWSIEIDDIDDDNIWFKGEYTPIPKDEFTILFQVEKAPQIKPQTTDETKITEIDLEFGLDFDDVELVIPEITTENNVYHDKAISKIAATLESGKKITVFYDKKTNDYCYQAKNFNQIDIEVAEDLASIIKKYSHSKKHWQVEDAIADLTRLKFKDSIETLSSFLNENKATLAQAQGL